MKRSVWYFNIFVVTGKRDVLRWLSRRYALPGMHAFRRDRSIVYYTMFSDPLFAINWSDQARPKGPGARPYREVSAEPSPGTIKGIVRYGSYIPLGDH